MQLDIACATQGAPTDGMRTLAKRTKEQHSSESIPSGAGANALGARPSDLQTTWHFGE